MADEQSPETTDTPETSPAPETAETPEQETPAQSTAGEGGQAAEAPPAQQPEEAPQAQEAGEAAQAQEPEEAPQAQEPGEAPRAEEPEEAPQAQEAGEAPQAEEPEEAPQAQEPGEAPQADEDVVIEVEPVPDGEMLTEVDSGPEPVAEASEETVADVPEESVAEASEEPVAEASEETVADVPEESVAEASEEPVAEAPEEPVAEARAEDGEPRESQPRAKPAVPGAHLEVDIVPEGVDPLGRGEEEDPYALVEEEEAPEQVEEQREELSGPISSAAIDLASDARYKATGKRKTAIARVTLRPGNGAYIVNGRTLEEYFPRETLGRNIRQPLETVGFQDQMDVVARLHGGGISAQAGALRHGVSRALLEADPNLRGELKRRGFLTRDSRAKERKKAGLKKARKRPQFSKR